LSVVHWEEFLDALELDDHALCYNQIWSKSQRQSNVFVDDGQRRFAPEWELTLNKFVAQTLVIYGFEHPWSEVPVHFYSGANNLMSKWIFCVFHQANLVISTRSPVINAFPVVPKTKYSLWSLWSLCLERLPH